LTWYRASGMTRHGMKMTTIDKSSIDPDVMGSVQKTRKIVFLLAVASMGALFIFGASRWSADVEDAIEWAGTVLIVICILGRTWCSLYIGGRKTSRLVTAGPYSVSRNPLYVFSVIGAVGIGAQLGAVSVAILAGIFAAIVHSLVVSQEERVMLASHGDVFRDYAARVPRFLPRLSGWKNVEMLEVPPRAVVTTFLDACFFLAAIPLAEFFEQLQRSGFIPVLLRLP
jgi:protein-S-isoprenylcysteine O-methyltransferase Ste14